MPRCADCGFLCVRDVQTRELVEVEHSLRQTGEFPEAARGKIEPAPLCLALAFDLADETAKLARQGFTNPARPVVLMERNCAAFTKWFQGFTPREHREMIEREEAKERERKWQDEVRARDQKFLRDQNWWNRFFGLCNVLVAAILAALATGVWLLVGYLLAYLIGAKP